LAAHALGEDRAVAAPDQTDVLGRRIGALIIDGLLLGVIFVVIGIASGGGHSGDGEASVRLGGAGTLVWALISLAYFCVAEGISGQTLGKRALGIKVVRTDRSAIGVGPALIRNVLRVIDALPAFYIVGLISVLATGQRRQRVGDLAADTIVVRA
jgi:uncharacterized RDD family membrane protein YckC